MAASPQTSELPAQPEAGRSLTPLATLDPLNGIPAALVARTEAMAEIVVAFRAFRNRSCRRLKATLKVFVESYNLERLQVSASTRGFYPAIAAATLEKAWRRFEKHGIAALVPGYGNRRGDSIIARNPSMREFAIALIAHNPGVRVPWCRDAIQTRFPGVALSQDTVWRFIRDWKAENASLFVRIKDPDSWRNRHMLALGDMEAGVTRVGQLHEVDGTPSDVKTLTEIDTVDGRLHLLTQIDVRSRKTVALLAQVESCDALARLFAKAIPILGMPEAIRHDNGAGFISAHPTCPGPAWHHLSRDSALSRRSQAVC